MKHEEWDVYICTEAPLCSRVLCVSNKWTGYKIDTAEMGLYEDWKF